MRKLGRKELVLQLLQPVKSLPPGLEDYGLVLSEDGGEVTFAFDSTGQRTGITTLLSDLRDRGIVFRDIDTKSSSLEDIFVSLVRDAS